MKTKSFTLAIFSALALVMILGMVSSAYSHTSNGINVAVTQDLPNPVTPGSTHNVKITVTNANGNSIDLSWADTTDTSGITSTVPANSSLANGSSQEFTFIYSIPSGFEGEDTHNIDLIANNGTIDTNFHPYATAIYSSSSSNTTNTTGDTPEDITDCSLGNDGDLIVEIEDITVIGGFGDDLEWLPMDKIEVELKIENDNDDYKIRDIEVHWGLYDSNKDRWYIDEKESTFKLSDGDEKTFVVNFKLEDDIDDLADGEYTFYVWTNDAYLDNTDTDVETPLCAYDSEAIDMVIESDFVILDNIEFPAEINCGDEFQLTADIWNIGDGDQEEVYVIIYNKPLGINEKVLVGDLDAFEDTKLDVLLKATNQVDTGKFYPISLSVYNEDDEVFQNDFDDDEADFEASVKVISCGVASSTVSVSASLGSEAVAGEALIVNAVVTNSGTSSETFVVRTSGFENWATATSTQTPVVLGAGESKEVPITLNVNSDASGTQTFTLEILSGTDVVSTKIVSVTLPEKSGFSLFNGISGNKYLWAIGFLNVLLVIIIIIVAIKVAMK